MKELRYPRLACILQKFTQYKYLQSCERQHTVHWCHTQTLANYVKGSELESIAVCILTCDCRVLSHLTASPSRDWTDNFLATSVTQPQNMDSYKKLPSYGVECIEFCGISSISAKSNTPTLSRVCNFWNALYITFYIYLGSSSNFLVFFLSGIIQYVLDESERRASEAEKLLIPDTRSQRLENVLHQLRESRVQPSRKQSAQWCYLWAAVFSTRLCTHVCSV